MDSTLRPTKRGGHKGDDVDRKERRGLHFLNVWRVLWDSRRTCTGCTANRPTSRAAFLATHPTQIFALHGRSFYRSIKCNCAASSVEVTPSFASLFEARGNCEDVT